MKQWTLLWANTLTLLGTLYINYYIGSGAYAEKTIGEVSSRYPSLVTPAGYAFSIWGLIYLLLIAFVGYQWFAWGKDRNDYSIRKSGIWFSLANIVNALWIFAWINEALGLSVLLILLLLFSLIRLVVRLDLEMWDAPLRVIAFVWWPITVYFGWIVLATTTNIAVYLGSQGWLENMLSPELWAIVVIAIATLIYLWLNYKRNMREAALVGVWGLVAIAFKQWEASQSVGIAALTGAVVLILYASYHGYQNRATSPFKKMKEATAS